MWNTNIYNALFTNSKIKGQLMAKYVPFLAPIRLLVGLHRGIQFNIPRNKDTYSILFNIITDLLIETVENKVIHDRSFVYSFMSIIKILRDRQMVF